MEAIGCVLAKTFVGTSFPRNSVFQHRNAPLSRHFPCIRVAKCSNTLSKIILALMEAIGCVLAKTFVGTSFPRNSVFQHRNAPLSRHFPCIRVAKCSKTLKHHFGSNGGYWVCSCENF